VELDYLEKEVGTPNSPEARQFIRRSLKDLRRSSTTVKLRSKTIARLNAICRSKRVVRDAFFNRIVFCLLAPRRTLNAIFGIGPFERKVAREWELPTDQHGWQPLRLAGELVSDPFWHIRACLEEAGSDNEVGNFYTAYIPENLFGDPKKALKPGERPVPSTIGFNVYLPDEMVPDHPAHEAMLKALDIKLDELRRS